MRDFVGYVRRHLSRRELPEDRFDEIVEELAAELESRYSTLLQNGSSEDEAWNTALAQIPSWPSFAHDLAASTGTRRPGERYLLLDLFSVERWLREFRLGFRALRKDRGFTLTAILTLAVCLGANAAIASFAESEPS